MGKSHCYIPSFFLGLKMLYEMMYPEYFNSVRPNSSLVGFSKTGLCQILNKTCLMYWKCSKVEDEHVRVLLSKYTVQKNRGFFEIHCSVFKT